jgi:hypothetical protein
MRRPKWLSSSPDLAEPIQRLAPGIGGREGDADLRLGSALRTDSLPKHLEGLGCASEYRGRGVIAGDQRQIRTEFSLDTAQHVWRKDAVCAEIGLQPKFNLPTVSS